MAKKEANFDLYIHDLLVEAGIQADTQGSNIIEINNTDEWIHSFYYYNDEIPTEEDFMNSIGDYLTFEFNMITHGKGYLFEQRGDAENA